MIALVRNINSFSTTTAPHIPLVFMFSARLCWNKFDEVFLSKAQWISKNIFVSIAANIPSIIPYPRSGL